MSDLPSDRPVLRIVKGDPTPDELAALVTVLATAMSQATPHGQSPSAWADRERGLRRPLRASRDGWRTSARPR